MLQIIGAEKVDEENYVICLASMLPWSLYCPKKCSFYNFVLVSARNLSLLKQFSCVHKSSLRAFSN